jgi:hypothetical protein
VVHATAWTGCDCVSTWHTDRQGDQAEAISDLLVYDKVGDGPWTLVTVGRCRDRLARQADGGWLFTSRELRFIRPASRPATDKT